MLTTTIVIALFGIVLTLFSRKRGGETTIGAIAFGMAGVGTLTWVALHSTLIGWSLPSFKTFALLFITLQCFAFAIALTGTKVRSVNGEPSAQGAEEDNDPINDPEEVAPLSPAPALMRRTVIASAVVALLGLALFTLAIVRGRGRPDELALRFSKDECARGVFSDPAESFEFVFENGGYRLRTLEVRRVEGHGQVNCSLELERSSEPHDPKKPSSSGKSISVYDGSTYGGTPLCTSGGVMLCGQAQLLLVEDVEISFVLGESRQRGFRLPNLEPFEPTMTGARRLVAPSRALLLLDAIGILFAVVAIVRARRALITPRISALVAVGVFLELPLLLALALTQFR